MQEHNKFEDLVLENNNKKNKQKQVLFKIIMVIIVFLIVLIIFKIVGSSDNSKPALPPIEPSAKFEQKSQDNEVFENLKSENDGFSDDFSSLEERLKKENNIVEAEPKKSQEVQNVVKELAKVTPIKEEVKQATQETTKAQESPKEVIQVKQEVKKETKPKQESSVFDTLNISKPTNLVKQETKAPSTSNQGSFIQVYAGKNIDLKSHEIKKLDTLGLQYKVVTDNKGMSRVIVGPYSNSDKANALKYIRDNVKKDAFYYHAK
ncbi:putative cell division protein FtsN [Campylobacter sp. RM5004]|uniref:SPOR domain-containing protein n=1 Tax=Campylobacter sp. RM5004 TaxID=1660078 RepID=UPI001EFAA7C4|nr:SPOR domain-containing protein [Campylobacter sp. RM5004]ULO02473.1 putative cell division protein FtsN [Campylobacter sp. RM5004]